jgi:hypothetical protein
MSENSIESQYEKVPVHCKVDDLQTTGFVLRRDLDRSERVGRAARMFGILFLIAFLTLFIPILHFVLPPLFLILGVVFATTTWMETGEVLRGEIECPNCKRKMELRKEAEGWPKTQRCEGCSYMLKIERA